MDKAVRLNVHCEQTLPGQIVKLVGSTPQLGNWQPANGLTLYTNPDVFPLWQNGILLDLKYGTIEYKYVIVQTEPSGIIQAQQEFVWEQLKENRTIDVKNCPEVVQDIFGIKNFKPQSQQFTLQSISNKISQPAMPKLTTAPFPVYDTPIIQNTARKQDMGLDQMLDEISNESSDPENHTPISQLLSDVPQVQLVKDDRVLIITFNLPLQITRDENGKICLTKQNSIINEVLFELQQKSNFITAQWIGYPGVQPKSDQEQLEIEALLSQYNCVPVWLPIDTFNQVFQFHEKVIKPLFHHYKSLNDFEFDLGKEELWRSYYNVNKIFQKTITQIAAANELIWIHDSYLLLLPTLIKRKCINAIIGFFLHTPWPPTDVLKMLPYRSEILKSMICCELIGFHIFEYARNFSTACNRILGHKYEFKKGGNLYIEANGRSILLRVSHVGVDISSIKSIFQSKDQIAFRKVRDFKEKLLAKIGQRSIVFGGYDRNSFISGIKNKLIAYLAFLDNYPRSRNQVCLIQFVTLETCLMCMKKDCQHISESHAEIDSLVQTIKSKYKGSILYYEQNLNKEERIALWSLINHLIITTYRDGQSIAPMEFVSVKKIEDKMQSSSVIMSEYSGCNRALGGVLRINPYNLEEITKAIDSAIQLLPEEREHRMAISFQYVYSHNALKWVELFLQNLKMTSIHQQMIAEETTIQVMGLGLQTTLIRTRVDFKELQNQLTNEEFQKAENRLIIISQEGVIPFLDQQPDPKAIHYLDHLSQQKNTQVIVISQSMRKKVHEWYSKAEMLGISAENGFFYRYKSKQCSDQDWNLLLNMTDFRWIESVKDIMRTYSEKTEGAFIEEKESMIVWNYRDTDQELGNYQANELTNHLEHLFSYLQLEVVRGKKMLQVQPSQVKKVKLVKNILRQFGSKKQIDFLLYIGDDVQSELVFQYLNKQKNTRQGPVNNNSKVMTCTIGRKVTQAKYFINSPEAVINLLQKLPEPLIQQINMSASLPQRRAKSVLDMGFNHFKMQKSISNKIKPRNSLRVTEEIQDKLDLSIEEQDEENDFDF